jgi:hypothetical protein
MAFIFLIVVDGIIGGEGSASSPGLFTTQRRRIFFSASTGSMFAGNGTHSSLMGHCQDNKKQIQPQE